MYKLSNKNQFDFDFFSDIVKSSNYRCVIKMFDMDKAIINFGKRIQEARILRNITQDQLAEKCGFERKMLYNPKHNGRYIRIVYFARICSALRVSADYLLFGK